MQMESVSLLECGLCVYVCIYICVYNLRIVLLLLQCYVRGVWGLFCFLLKIFDGINQLSASSVWILCPYAEKEKMRLPRLDIG